jgi:4-aminobutyrate aminotransferase-like enzyme
VRGKGLLLGFDLVSDRKTKTPLPTKLTHKIYTECVRRGLLVMAYGARVRINPPLVISEEEADAGLDIFESVLADVAPEIG